MPARPLHFKLAAATVVLVLALATLEALARTVGLQIPALEAPTAGSDTVLLNPHPTRLWYTAPGVKRSAGFTSTINALGLRGALPADPKPAGVPRVLVVGDSSLFGHGVADDETYPAQLEQILLGLGRRVEVLNGGTPGYSTEQTRIFLAEDGWALQPDLLVIASVWSDNNFDSFRDADLLHTQHAFANPLARSALYRLLASWADVLQGGRGARIVTWTQAHQVATEAGRRVSLPRYVENLDAMVNDATTRDIGVLFLTLTNLERVKGDRTRVSWEPYLAAQREVALFHGAPLLDAQLVYTSANLADPQDLFVDAMHPSALGHQLLARLTARRLVGDGWPTRARYVAPPGHFPGTAIVDIYEQGERAPFSSQDALFVK
ncbi:MAG: SGNH/GDSL hydrolase family protein [Pseudomonadota bacterium]|nr:SGNH/GDSL hydrolase family protein [Pseudomonadota bacterium]